MWIRVIIIAMILSFGFMDGAYAKEDCSDPQTQTDMNICAHIKYQETDRVLNETYQKAIVILKDNGDKDKVEDFRKIQRAWIKFRDLNCNYSATLYRGGTLAPLIYSNCMERLTRERTNQIPDLFTEWNKRDR